MPQFIAVRVVGTVEQSRRFRVGSLNAALGLWVFLFRIKAKPRMGICIWDKSPCGVERAQHIKVPLTP